MLRWLFGRGRSEGEGFGVYQIRNTVTGKLYIGATSTSFADRWQSHRNALVRKKHANRALQHDWIQYGVEAFEFSVLEYADSFEAAFEREQVWQEHVHAQGLPCYNRPPALPQEYEGGLSPDTIRSMWLAGWTKTRIVEQMIGGTAKRLAILAAAIADLPSRSSIPDMEAYRAVSAHLQFTPEEIARIAQRLYNGETKSKVVQTMPGYSGPKYKVYTAYYERMKAAIDEVRTAS